MRYFLALLVALCLAFAPVYGDEHLPTLLATGPDLAIGYFDAQGGTFYAWRGVRGLKPDDFPETFGAFGRGLPLDLTALQVVEVDPPRAYLREADGRFLPGYYQPVYKRFFTRGDEKAVPEAQVPRGARVLVSPDVVNRVSLGLDSPRRGGGPERPKRFW